MKIIESREFQIRRVDQEENRLLLEALEDKKPMTGTIHGTGQDKTIDHCQNEADRAVTAHQTQTLVVVRDQCLVRLIQVVARIVLDLVLVLIPVDLALHLRLVAKLNQPKLSQAIK